MSAVVLENEGAVAVVTLNRPEVRNALSEAAMLQLADVLGAVRRDPGVRAVVLTGAPPAFSAGGDLGDLPDDPDTATLARRHEVFLDAAEALHRLDVPTVAAVGGAAIGAGCSLALLCDLVVAGPDARFGVGFLPVALPPDLFSAALLQRRAGSTVAADLLFSGRTIGAEEAHALRLVNEVVDDPLAAALGHAHRVAGWSPFAVRQAKAMLRAAWPPLDAARAHEALAVAVAAGTEEFAAVAERFRRPS